jgi:hypothetical protein
MADKPATTRRRGQPTLLTPETKDRIVSVVKSGAYLDDAAAYVGVGRSTVFLWLTEGRKATDKRANGQELTEHEQRCADFLDAVETARAEAGLRNLALIQTAAQEGAWQAAAWYLERTNPRKWGRHDTVELTGADGGPIQVEHSVKDSLAAKFAAAERAARDIIEAEPAEDTEPGQLRAAK